MNIKHIKSNHFNFVKRTGASLLSLILPATCIECEDILHHTQSLGLCNSCWKSLPWWDKSIQIEPELPVYVDSFNAPLLYEEEIQKLVTMFKFYDTPEYADTFARIMQHYLPTIENPLIIPVPIHRLRLWNRGFNQADLLADKIAKYTANSFTRTALLRIKHTPKQTGSNKQKRRKILKTAFWVDTNKVKNKNIILIDDVWTTGSTAHVCAKTLKKAGASSVHVVTLCYTPI